MGIELNLYLKLPTQLNIDIRFGIAVNGFQSRTYLIAICISGLPKLTNKHQIFIKVVPGIQSKPHSFSIE